MMTVKASLKQMFQDPDYAWQLLQSQIKIQLSPNLNGDDISHLLQLYMRGVQKMNSFVDLRQSFFKNKVTTLMTKPNVIKIFNNPMSKKKNPQVIQVSSPTKKLGNKTQLQLKQKRKQMQMRLAYGAEQHSPDVLRKLMAQQGQKQQNINVKIQKIIDSHEQRLKQRLKKRKLRTITAKSRSELVPQNNQINGFHQQNDTIQQNGIKKNKLIEMLNQKKDQQQFGMIRIKTNKQINRRKIKSVQQRKTTHFNLEDSPNKGRRISIDFEKLQQI